MDSDDLMLLKSSLYMNFDPQGIELQWEFHLQNTLGSQDISLTEFVTNKAYHLPKHDSATVLNSKFTSGSPFSGLHRVKH